MLLTDCSHWDKPNHSQLDMIQSLQPNLHHWMNNQKIVLY